MEKYNLDIRINKERTHGLVLFNYTNCYPFYLDVRTMSLRLCKEVHFYACPDFYKGHYKFSQEDLNSMIEDYEWNKIK